MEKLLLVMPPPEPNYNNKIISAEKLILFFPDIEIIINL